MIGAGSSVQQLFLWTLTSLPIQEHHLAGFVRSLSFTGPSQAKQSWVGHLISLCWYHAVQWISVSGEKLKREIRQAKNSGGWKGTDNGGENRAGSHIYQAVMRADAVVMAWHPHSVTVKILPLPSSSPKIFKGLIKGLMSGINSSLCYLFHQ